MRLGFAVLVGSALGAALWAANTSRAAAPAGAVAQSARRPIAERVTNVSGIENMGRVAPGIYRGAAPSDQGLDTLRALGVKTVINLRHYHGAHEERACRERGIEYVHLVLASSHRPSDDAVRQFLAVVTDPKRQPVYFHCWRGKDRTGVMCAAYRMAIEDWPLADALAEMDAYGFFHGWHDLRAFVDSFASRRSEFRPATLPPPYTP